MGAYARWRSLAARHRRLTLESALAVAAAAVSLRVRGLDRTLRAAARPLGGAPFVEIPLVVAAIDRAARYVPGSTCLATSLAMSWMLRRRGVEACVRIGTRTDRGRLQAHAWVERDGAVLSAESVTVKGYTAVFGR